LKRSLFLFFLTILAFPLGVFSEEEESLDLIYQKISDLEQEIATLRNLIEENTYLIERYQELQQQRYLDLDKRLHNLLSEEQEDLDTEYLNGQQYNSTEEIDLYKGALELFEASRYAEALESFRELIISYPEGAYSADAYFWSGELYLVQQLFDDAREHYLVVVELNKALQTKNKRQQNRPLQDKKLSARENFLKLQHILMPQIILKRLYINQSLLSSCIVARLSIQYPDPLVLLKEDCATFYLNQDIFVAEVLDIVLSDKYFLQSDF
jgi:tetratricopeptide (TPR) repeat protein